MDEVMDDKWVVWMVETMVAMLVEERVAWMDAMKVPWLAVGMDGNSVALLVEKMDVKKAD